MTLTKESAQDTVKKSVEYLHLKQQHFLKYFFDNFDCEQCLPLVRNLLTFQGTIFFSGIGKSSFVAKKVATTFMSLGQKSYFLSVESALHGDVGIVKPGDIVCFLSKSGESQEILDLVVTLKEKSIYLYALTSNKSSQLAKKMDWHIFLPCIKELCPYNLIPTISTELQLIACDLITASFLSLKRISLKEYASNHPKGLIGKKTSLLVKDVMLPFDQLPICFTEDKIETVLPILSEKCCGCVLIINPDNNLLGIFTDGDLRRALQSYGKEVVDLSIGSLMNTTAKTVISSELAWTALMEMETGRSITVLPVLSEDRELVGMIRMHDLVKIGLV